MSFRTVNPAGARKMLESGGHAVIDVRTVAEFEEGHVPGAFNVPIAFRSATGMVPNDEFAPTMARRFKKDARLIFVWKAGARSQRACELLAAEGFTQLVNMQGGFHGAYDRNDSLVEAGWAACGFDQSTESSVEQTWEHLRRG